MVVIIVVAAVEDPQAAVQEEVQAVQVISHP